MTAPKNPQPPPPELVRCVLSDDQEEALRVTVGARVRLVRQELGLTQHQLASAFGLGQTALAMIENGRAFARHAMLAALASASGRSVAWFFGEPDRRT